MRIAITSRIFAPEAGAASFRLEALANAFAAEEHSVEVLTVRPSRRSRSVNAHGEGRAYRVKRFPVLRDHTGYVRGYVQYLSFDIPLLFRLLFGRKNDLVVTEPPPTTGFFVRLACGTRRIPYAYYAADIWSDATESTGSPAFVVRVVRWMERYALRGSRTVLAVNDGVAGRVRELAPHAQVVTTGNGIDLGTFTVDGPRRAEGEYFVYAGTASEWQGASIFIDAFSVILREHANCRLVFLGQGSDWPALKARARKLPTSAIQFVPTVPAAEAAEWLRGAVASIASIRPDSGYTYAFPTKLFASWGVGTPVIYAGEGPVGEFMARHVDEAELGSCCNYDVVEVVSAMRCALSRRPAADSRSRLGEWASSNIGLDVVAERAVRLLGGAEAERNT